MLNIGLPSKDNGEMRISGIWSATIGPHMSRTEFLQTPMGRHSSPETMRPPYFEYELRSAGIMLGDRPVFLAVRFENEALLSCSIYLDLPHEWSEPAALAVKAIQDEILRSHYGTETPIKFPWGTVSSLYQPQHAGADIGIVYRVPSFARRP